jgi:hypothetical protein
MLFISTNTDDISTLVTAQLYQHATIRQAQAASRGLPLNIILSGHD